LPKVVLYINKSVEMKDLTLSLFAFAFCILHLAS